MASPTIRAYAVGQMALGAEIIVVFMAAHTSVLQANFPFPAIFGHVSSIFIAQSFTHSTSACVEHA